MLFNLLLTLLGLIPVTPVFAGQFPVVNDVIGGVRSTEIPSTRRIALSGGATTPGKLRYVSNSGICEITSGVNQFSGYGDLSFNKSIFFWFFESRNNPYTDPLALWFNGGPGSSSMIGLFEENGPCRITNDSSSVTLNPYSWNNHANVLYIDQPVGVGFSHGVTQVGTSEEAADDVWMFLQMFLRDSQFGRYANNSLAIWTESYGGHYGPTFANYFLEQNKGIENGTVSGIPLNLRFLGIGNGLTDPITQYPGYITYAQSNPYHPLVSASIIAAANKSYTKPGGCAAQITSCNKGGSDAVCSAAQQYCNDKILFPLAGNYDAYYVLSTNPDSYPPNITSYLASIGSEVGAESTWEETNEDVYNNFVATGDWMRSKKRYLENVIDAGVRTLIYDGDADYIVNFHGVEAMVNSLKTTFSTQYGQQSFSPYTVNGVTAGQYKQAGTFSYLRIYGAGHEVPAYRYGSLGYGEAASQFFEQIMGGGELVST